ncbi:uncharacterized protein LOC108022317 [Drosophila biarmipes]|uniref:uncharacterized protein LOC108022317 n=1 Tax=Drosophila biarmipes TaxID=125945 RepID=UPI0007E82EDF|nr:uncharacterized protein LOC108022317 [Drosophila biarmipes]
MLVLLIGLALLLQANSIAGQGYQVYGSGDVQVIYPSSAQVQVFGGRPFRRGLWNIVRNFTITANATSQDDQLVSLLGNGNIALSGSQNAGNGNGPLRALLRTLFGRQPNVQFVNLSGRAFNDRPQGLQYWKGVPPYTGSVLLPRTRVKAVGQSMPRRILVRNLKTSQSQMTNVVTYRIPVLENDWQYDTTYAE